jgi:hypothetical protein
MDKMWWAVLNDSDDILHYVEAETEEEAVRVYAEKAHVPPEDTKWLYAIPGDGIRDDVEIEGWLLSAIEFDPEFAFGPEESSPETWKEYRKAIAKLRARGIHPEDIVGWVRTNATFDLWSPVVK